MCASKPPFPSPHNPLLPIPEFLKNIASRGGELMRFAFPFCNFFYLPQTKQLCLHLMDQRTNVTFAVIGAIKKTQCHWLIICWDHNTQHTGCAWAIFVFCLAWLMFPPPIPLWGSYPIPLGKQLLSSPQFSHSILGHSEKGL